MRAYSTGAGKKIGIYRNSQGDHHESAARSINRSHRQSFLEHIHFRCHDETAARRAEPTMLFPSVLGVEFAALDPCLRWVHSGDSRKLRGRVTVERGTNIAAKVLGVVTTLSSTMTDAPIEVRIEVTEIGETWARLFASHHLTVSTLQRDRGLLVERLGPVAFKFRLLVRDGTLEWVLEHISSSTGFAMSAPDGSDFLNDIESIHHFS